MNADRSYYEDVAVGAEARYGDYLMTQEEIIRFASVYDAQYFHIDPEAAKNGPFGGLAASGWHSCAVMMRLMYDHQLSHYAALASPGFEDLRWLQPVRPGDRLSVLTKIADKRLLKSKPDRGLLTIPVAMFNQKQEMVLSVRTKTFLQCRPQRP